jgi:hypothetical protein
MLAKTVSLADFAWEDLLILQYHFEYAASRLKDEAAGQRHQPDSGQSITFHQLAGILNDYHHFIHLSQAVAQAVNGNRTLDLIDWLKRNSGQTLLEFLYRELKRSRQAATYIGCLPFDLATKADVVYALELESRLFERLIGEIARMTATAAEVTPLWPSPGEARLPLLYISLPKPLIHSETTFNSPFRRPTAEGDFYLKTISSSK